MNKKLFFYFTNLFLLTILFYSNTFSQSRMQYNLFTESDNSTNIMNSPEMKRAINEAVILDVNRAELQSLYENRNPEITMNIPYENGRSATINLERFDILSPNAKILAHTLSGDVEIGREDLIVSYKGKVEGLDNTFIVMNFSRESIVGLMVSGNDNYILGAITDNAGHETENHILYKESNLKVKNNFNCAASDDLSSDNIDKMRKAILSKMNDLTPTDLYIAEIAVEIDFATYNVYSQSTITATNYALSVVAAASAIYMKEVNVKLIVPFTRVWTTTDPYPGTNSNEVLNAFRNYWNANMQAVPRTLAHLISRRAGNMGGIAWLNALCASPSSGYGYAFSNTQGPVLPLPTYSWDVMVVSHETGHNFGSLHTHNCNWVGGIIDSCYQVEGGCYTGPAVSAVGTIMSYCHLNGSISLTKGFGPQPMAVLRNGAESAGCMYVSQRDLYVAYPNGGELFRTGDDTRQIYWGTSLTGNVNIELSLNNGATWQPIQNNVPATERRYNWTIASMPTTDQAKIRIISSTNPSIGDTCDAAFRIVLNLNMFDPITPPSFSRIEVSGNSTDVLKFVWSRAGTDPTIRYKFKLKKLGTNTDNIYVSDNGGADTVFTVRKSFLDSLAFTLGTTGDSIRATWRATAFNGFDSTSVQNAFLITLVRTTVGINMTSTIIPEKFALANNYPNPFNPTTNIKFDVPLSTFVELKIFDLSGREVSTLVNEKLQPGTYEYSFEANNLSSGTYFYRLNTSEFTETKRMILLK
ncbi:MAG: zinc-dependent metalloprotease [Ignavibacteria bacterium]